MLKIAKARRRPYIPIHVPEFMLKIVLGEMSIEVLKSATMDDSKIRNTGFNFIFPTVDAALNDLIRRR
jgi:NAD dependent epimerase/dehydratase family enzyme